MTGNLNALSALTPAFWTNIGIDLLAVMLSMGATILLAAAMNALGRSLTFGLCVSLIWFSIDNFGTALMDTLARLAHQDFWLNITAYVLGPLLNRLPDMLLLTEAQKGFQSIGVEPMVSVSGSHALWVIRKISFVISCSHWGLDINHGYSKRPVENSEVVKKRTALEKRLANVQRWAEGARKRCRNASKLYTKRCKLTKERAKELYRLLNNHQIELEQQGMEDWLLWKTIREEKAVAGAEIEEYHQRQWKA